MMRRPCTDDKQSRKIASIEPMHMFFFLLKHANSNFWKLQNDPSVKTFVLMARDLGK